MQSIGTMLPEVREIFQNGRKFYKAKVLVPLDKPLKDRLSTKHPTLGRIMTCGS
jgi:hypothetical protein